MTKFIDFNNLSAGTVVDNEFSSQGVTISAVGGSGKAMIFDTDNPTGGDDDLETSNLGGALIISEDGDSHDPDDEGDGGKLIFTFDEPATVNRLTFLDIEEGAKVIFYDASGEKIGYVNIDDTDNNGQLIQDFDVSGVTSMEVKLFGSGAIDNLVFDDSASDGVVEGNNDANEIDADYEGDPDGDMIDAGDAVLPGEGPDDDIVDAFGGDDTIKAGNGDDDVYAGSGSDSVEGGKGDDLIYGDANYSGPDAGATTRESLEWDQAGASDGETLTGFTQDTGNVEVTFSISQQSGASRTEFADNSQNVENIDGDGDPINDDSSLANVLNGSGNSADYNLAFSAPVEDVSFRINDIDGDGVVYVKAYDADGNQIVVNLEGGDRLTMSDTDGVAGDDTADSNGGYLSDSTGEYSVLVSIPGPVSRIEIEHDQNGGSNSGINITDVYFDAPVIDDGSAGDDTLEGGYGDDTIFGEGGDDVISGGDDEDSLIGGEGDDTIDGGKGDDTIEGGAGSDSILGGYGDDLITSSDPANDLLVDKGYPGVFPGEGGTPAAENERDFVDGGAGNDTISTGDDRDTIVGGEGDDVIDGGIDDDKITGDEGADRIVGGEGNDLIKGGDGDDTIYAGNDPDLGLGFLDIEDDGSNPLGPDLRPDNGRDTVYGGEGNDVIYGADDDDKLFGGEGDDTIDGEIDDDFISGGTGDDSLIGGQGDDTIKGGDGQDTIDGGIGEDNLKGGADEDLFVNVNAGDVVDGSGTTTTGTDYDTLDLTGSAPEGGSFKIDITGPDSNGNGFDGVVNYFDSDGNDAGSLTFSEIEEIIPCFTPGTMIATASGERPVQDLAVGDRVITRDNGIQEIRWIGKRAMTGDELNRAAHLRPVLIRKGALGKGLPERDMLVSPQHRVLMASDKTALYFDEAEVLVAAKHLTDMDGIDVVEVSGTTYIHVMFDQHEVILSDGAWTESFQPGDQSLASMGDAQRAEILELFPELETEVGIEAYTAARRSLKKYEAKLLTQ